MTLPKDNCIHYEIIQRQLYTLKKYQKTTVYIMALTKDSCIHYNITNRKLCIPIFGSIPPTQYMSSWPSVPFGASGCKLYRRKKTV